MAKLYILYVSVSCLGLVSLVPIDKDNKPDLKQAQEKEYYRYVNQVITELEKDPAFSARLMNVTEEDIVAGKIAHLYDSVGHKVRKRLDEVKRLEIEYQRELIRQRKHHMSDEKATYWNPLHHDNKFTFEKDDLKKLLETHARLMEEGTKRDHEEFKRYKMEKEHKRREAMKNMTNEERIVAETKYNASLHKPHEKLHEPGHKAQLEEVWEKEDGLDSESFDPKTFFNLHDKNGDGHLDQYEIDTILLYDVEKAYNESDPNTDSKERDEEMARMREHMLDEMDANKDRLLSMEEFLDETKNEDFEKDNEWKPLTEEKSFTDDQFEAYERSLDESGKASDGIEVNLKNDAGVEHEDINNKEKI